MTELEKIEYAKSFIDKLANGINPIDDLPVPEGDIVNNVRLSRCFFYVSDILRQVIENGGINAQVVKKVKKTAFSLSNEQRAQLNISHIPLTVSEIADYLNSLIDTEAMTKLTATIITNWLVDIGLLEVYERRDGKKSKRPTSAGMDMGIITEERSGQYGNYTVVMYPPEMQQFIYDNIDSAIALKHESKDNLAEFHARPWTETHISMLTEMFDNGKSISEMAYELKRTENGIRSQLNIMGLTK